MPKAKSASRFTDSGLKFEAQPWAAAEQAVPASPRGMTEFNSARPEGLFLKYISDAFEEMRAQLLFGVSDPRSEWFIKDEPQRAEAAENRRDFSLSASNGERAGARCRFLSVPPEARWHTINAKAKSPEIGIMQTRRTCRPLKKAEARAPIPTGLHPSAQGCPASGTTLGNVIHHSLQPQRGCINHSRARGCNPFRVVELLGQFPRAAPRQSGSDQPWAGRRSPVGAKPCRDSSLSASLGERIPLIESSHLEPLNRSSRRKKALNFVSGNRMSLLTSAATRFTKSAGVRCRSRSSPVNNANDACCSLRNSAFGLRPSRRLSPVGVAGFVMAKTTSSAHSCSMKSTEDVRKYSAEQGIAEEKGLKKRMEIYVKA